MKTTGVLMESIRVALETAEEDGYRRGLADGMTAALNATAKALKARDDGARPWDGATTRKSARDLVHEYKVVGFDVCDMGNRGGHSSACDDLVELLERYAAQERSAKPA